MSGQRKIEQLEKQVADLAAKLEKVTGRPVEPFKREPPTRPLDLTARASMPKAVVKDMATSRLNATIDDKLFAGLTEDAYPSLRQSKGELSRVRIEGKSAGVPQERSATPGYVDPSPMWPPAGVNIWPKQADAPSDDSPTNDEGRDE
jgi:hypothetical protein